MRKQSAAAIADEPARQERMFHWIRGVYENASILGGATIADELARGPYAELSSSSPLLSVYGADDGRYAVVARSKGYDFLIFLRDEHHLKQWLEQNSHRVHLLAAILEPPASPPDIKVHHFTERERRMERNLLWVNPSQIERNRVYEVRADHVWDGSLR